MCQGCSETRCRACRSGKSTRVKLKLSIEEQISLYNDLNRELLGTDPLLCVTPTRIKD